MEQNFFDTEKKHTTQNPGRVVSYVAIKHKKRIQQYVRGEVREIGNNELKDAKTESAVVAAIVKMFFDQLDGKAVKNS